MKFRYILIIFITLLMFSCDDMEDKPKPENTSGIYNAGSLLILSEGLFNLNNSTLGKFDFTNQTFDAHYFQTVNQRGLGDTGNDMAIYGSKIYIVVNVSGCVEVINAMNGKSIKQIRITDANNLSRQPRFITFYKNKAYVCNFDGTVCRIDTTDLRIEATIQCGKNPDGICTTSGKLYVSNSGGLNYPIYDNTVSVIDIGTFSELTKITVGLNPGKIVPDSQGDIYLVARGDYSKNEYQFQKINTVTNQLQYTFNGVNPLNFQIHNDTAYLYEYNFNTKESVIKVFDCKSEQLISDNFITDSTKLVTPYDIEINPVNGDVYVTDAKNYLVYGDVLCFNKNGKLRFRLKEIGLNPNKVLFN